MERRSSKQLYNKLFFTYTAVLVCIVTVLVFYFISNIKSRTLETNLEYMHMMSDEALKYMEYSSNIADYLQEDLYQSEMELNDLLHYLQDEPEEYQKYRLDTFMKSGVSNYKGIDDFAEDAFEAYSGSLLKRLTFISYDSGKVTAWKGSRSVWHNDNGDIVLDRIAENNLDNPGEISFLKEIRDPKTMQSVAGMIITFDTAYLSELQSDYPKAELLVYNDAGTVILDSAGDIDINRVETARTENCLAEELGAYVRITEPKGHRMVGYLKKNEASVLPLATVYTICITGMIILAVGEILVWYYLKKLSERLNRIMDGMTNVMKGDLKVRLQADVNGDELDLISEHFNEMCEKLDLYIQKSYLAEIEQKNAEMEALQSQINPHFLYNTLEAIRMKAICNGDREVGKMLYSMAVTFRSQIKEADVISLMQELHYCKKYMELFEFRYQNQFRAYVNCPEEYKDVPIIKFVLQPLIENYFIHGIRMGADDNFIRISVRKDGEDYEILVEDNGRGMTDSEIEAKNEQLRANKEDRKKSIGMSNVNRRIKAVYGSEYGIRIEAGEQQGLRTILRFNPSEGKYYEKSYDCGR